MEVKRKMTDDEFRNRLLSLEEIEKMIDDMEEDCKTSKDEAKELKNELSKLEEKVAYFEEYMYLLNRKIELEKILS